MDVDAEWNTSSVWVGVITGQERARLIAASTLDSDVVVDYNPDTVDFVAG